MLTFSLMEESGLIDEKVCRLEPRPASEEDILRVHTPEYLAAVKLEEPDLALGLGSDDTPVFAGICESLQNAGRGLYRCRPPHNS